MEDRVSKILSEVKDLGPELWDNAKLSSTVRAIAPPLSNSERIKLVSGLIRKDLFLWLDYVSDEIRNLASTDESYISFLSELIGKVKRDLSGGQIIQALTSVGETNPELGIELSLAMRKRREEGLMIYSSFPLGGAGRAEFGKVKPVLDDLWQSGDYLQQVAALRAYRIIIDPIGGQQKPISDETFLLFETAASSDNADVRNEAAQGLFDLAKVNEQRSMKTLIQLLGKAGPIRSLIANRLQLKNDFSKENTVTLLKLVTQDDDNTVLGQVSMVLMFHGKDFPRQAIEMVISIAERGKYRTVYELDYAAEQAARADLAGTIRIVQDSFTKTTSDHFKFIAPHLLVDISKSNYLLLADFVKAWIRDKKFEKLAITTGREMLRNVFGSHDQSVADILYPTLEAITIEKGLNVKDIIRGETDKVAQCIELLNAIERERPRLDYDEIEANLNQFPSLKEFLGDRWIRQRKSENNRTHEILNNLAYLSRESELEELLKQTPKNLDPLKLWARSMRARGLLWPRAMLDYLSMMVEGVRELPKVSGLKVRLTQDDQFDGAFSELQIISSFAKSHIDITIEPALGTKALDLEALVENKRVLFEVKNPNLFRKLKYSGGGSVPNRARTIIYQEFTQHLADIPKGETRPIIIVMDIGRSEIDYDFIADYLFGTLQFTWLRDKRTGEVIDKGWSRADDSLHKQSEKTLKNLDLISAVICYKTVFGDDGRFHLQGTMFLNPTAQNPLTGGQSEKISKALFGVSLQETSQPDRGSAAIA